MIRVLIADDQQLVRSGFHLILGCEDDMEVVGEAANGFEAIDSARRLRPDVVLMDLRMPHLDGVQATAQLASAGSDTVGRVLVVTTFDNDEYVFAALRAGASGFILKDAPPEELAAAVRVVAAGEGLLAPSVTRRLIEEFARRPVPPDDSEVLRALTDREREVLRMVARGLSNGEIAGALGIGETTVKTHVSRMLTKLGLRDRAQAVVLAYEAGLVHPGVADPPAKPPRATADDR
jgi:DNA-binding NarL/FixJ family response regulator